MFSYGIFLLRLYHFVTGVCGISFNLLLLYLAVFKAPKAIRTYTVLIINFAFAALLVSFSSFAIEQRVIPLGTASGYVSYGFCSLFGHFWCKLGYATGLHLQVHSLWSLLLSFSYRLYILTNSPPTPLVLATIVGFLYIPSFIQFCCQIVMNMDPNDVQALIKITYPSYEPFDVDTLTGTSTAKSFMTMYPIMHMTAPVIPIYTGILILRYKIVKKMNISTEHMRAETRQLHRQLLMALTIQAVMPAFFLAGSFLFTIAKIGIIRHPVIECATFGIMNLMPLFSPLIYLYTIGPFRKGVVNLFRRQILRQDIGATSVQIIAPSSKSYA